MASRPSTDSSTLPKGVIPKGVIPRGVMPKGVMPQGIKIGKIPSVIKISKNAILPTAATVIRAATASTAATAETATTAATASTVIKAATAATRPKSIKKPIDISSSAISSTDIHRYFIDEQKQSLFTKKLPKAFSQYSEDQENIVTTNPYKTETELYIPQTRRSFNKFIKDNYQHFQLLPTQLSADEDACKKLEQAGDGVVESFLYQQFIREYIRISSPYRGILVYHGLGSGKTCSAIAAAEAIYGTSNKKIIVMTPFSLRNNFISEISFCGFRHFNLTNHWVSIPYLGNPIIEQYAISVLSLTEEYFRNLRKKDVSRQVIWVPDFTKPSNYKELNSEQQNDIRAQIITIIEQRITFINYNGVTQKVLKEYACTVDPVTGNRMFDDKIIVIDEFHNLSRLMRSKILPYIIKRNKRKRKVEVEPITPGKWQPGLCDTDMRYDRAYLLYKLLTDARNSKIIALSGTPIINFPDELGIIANVLAGYTEAMRLTISTTDKAILAKCKELIDQDLRVDMIDIRAENIKNVILITIFNEGYEKVFENNKFLGVRYNPEAQYGIQQVYENIKDKLSNLLTPKGISLDAPEYVSYERLPIDEELFISKFINRNPIENHKDKEMRQPIKNELVLKKRLTGLISYYAGSKKEFMPSIGRGDGEEGDVEVECEMSDYMLNAYTIERKKEIKNEQGKVKETGDKFSSVEVFAKMGNPSSYRFRSRAVCNFAFPTEIPRPFPNTLDETDEIDEMENADVAEAEYIISEEDAEAMKEIEKEEQEIQLEEPIDEPIDEQVDKQDNELDEKESQEGGYMNDYIKDMKYTGGSGKSTVIRRTLGSQKSTVPIPDATVSNATASVPVATASVPVASTATDAIPVASTASTAPVKLSIKELQQRRKEAAASIASASAAPVPAPPVPAPVPAPAAPASTAPATPAPVKLSIKELRQRQKEATASTVVTAATAATASTVATASTTAPTVPYTTRIANAMNKLDSLKMKYLTLTGSSSLPESKLVNYSSKMAKMLENVLESPGSNLVYSQFKTVEGLGVFGVVLKANGFTEIKIEGIPNHPRFSEETEKSFTERPDEKRYILFTGEGSREYRALILNIFNGNFDKLPASMSAVLNNATYNVEKNKYGKICWVIGITGAGAEGISLKCCRTVHIMEPYWNKVRLEQVKGRAIRICSHKDFEDPKERNVKIFTYYTVFSKSQLGQRDMIDMQLLNKDKGITSDHNVLTISKTKDLFNSSILKLMKESAVDCELNEADNNLDKKMEDKIQCTTITGSSQLYTFHPDLQQDIIDTPIFFKEDVKAIDAANRTSQDIVTRLEQKMKKEKSGVSGISVDDALSKVQSSSATITIAIISIKDTEYLSYPAKGKGGYQFNIYSRDDINLTKVIGEYTFDPITEKINEYRFY